MELKFEEELLVIPGAESQLRLHRIADELSRRDIDAVLISDHANLFYVTGRIFCGWALVWADGSAEYFVRRPSTLHGYGLHRIRKVEELPGCLSHRPARLGLELDLISWSAAERIRAAFGEGVEIVNASAAMRAVRSVKTAMQIDLMAESGIKQTMVYNGIAKLYREGMSDIELQIEIERSLRLHGCLGKFPVSGPDMEIFMANVLTGENADVPSPYDFAMGGAGLHPSLPVGADGTIIKPHNPVMVDANGNFTAYMTDMTRCFCLGEPPAEAVRLNTLSADICRAISEAARPGTAAKGLYELALGMATDAGAADYFMGHRYHAGFVGHGVGIEINEGPVLAPRSRDIIQEGNTIALEPKFVVPGLGAVGVENTYAVTADGPRLLTLSPQNIVQFD